jgi:hypothetical protein
MEDISNFFSGNGQSSNPVEHQEGESKTSYDRKMLEIMKKLNFRGREKVQILRNRQPHQVSDVNYDIGVSKESIITAYESKIPSKTMPNTTRHSQMPTQLNA